MGKTRAEMLQRNNEINWSTPKLAEALASVPPDVRPHFKAMIEDMLFGCLGNGAPIRNWKVFAHLVRRGWRRSARDIS